MNKRKLMQHGPSSLTVSLPIEWVKANNLTKGNEVSIEIDGKNLSISTDENKKSNLAIVNVSGFDRTSVLLCLQSLYRLGYDGMQIEFDNITTPHYRIKKSVTYSSVIHEIVGRMVGAEIIAESRNKIEVKVIAKEMNENFESILRRIFLLIKDALSTLIEGMKEKNLDIIGTVEEKHDNISKFVIYCLRILSKQGHVNSQSTNYYFHIIANLDKVADIIKYNARASLTNKSYSKKTIELLRLCESSFSEYHLLFYKFDPNKVNLLNKQRDEFKIEVLENCQKLPQKELMILARSEEILELLLDLVDYRIGLEYTKG